MQALRLYRNLSEAVLLDETMLRDGRWLNRDMEREQPVRDGESTARWHGKIRNILGSARCEGGRLSVPVGCAVYGGRTKMAFERRALAEEQWAGERLSYNWHPWQVGLTREPGVPSGWKRWVQCFYTCWGKGQKPYNHVAEAIFGTFHIFWGERLCILPKEAWFCDVSSRYQGGKED